MNVFVKCFLSADAGGQVFLQRGSRVEEPQLGARKLVAGLFNRAIDA
jgi:hypothetical protein